MLPILLMEMIQPCSYIYKYIQTKSDVFSNACMIDKTPTPFPSDIFRSIKITLMSADFQVMEERIKMAQCIASMQRIVYHQSCGNISRVASNHSRLLYYIASNPAPIFSREGEKIRPGNEAIVIIVLLDILDFVLALLIFFYNYSYSYSYLAIIVSYS